MSTNKCPCHLLHTYVYLIPYSFFYKTDLLTYKNLQNYINIQAQTKEPIILN